MYEINSQGDTVDYGVLSYTADTPDDVENLPTSDKLGSTCFVISTGDVYILNGSKEWTLLA